MPEVLRVGLLGCGRIARLFHMPVLAGLSEATVVAVAEAAPAALESAAAASGAEPYADWRDALDPGRLDAAVICLPPALHAEAAVAALEAGLHVYLEKPLALTLDEGVRAVEAWRRSDRVGRVGFNFRHNDGFRALKRRLGAGEAGEPLVLRTLFTSARRELPPWKRARETGGGALRDLGVHHLDLIPWLVGSPVVRVRAEEWSSATEGDCVLVGGETRSGARFETLTSLSTGHGVNRVEVYGARGHVTADTADAAPRAVEVPPGRFARLRRLRDATARLHPRELLHAPGKEPSFEHALTGFVHAALGLPETSPAQAGAADLEDGLRALKLVLAAEEAARTGASVLLPD